MRMKFLSVIVLTASLIACGTTQQGATIDQSNKLSTSAINSETTLTTVIKTQSGKPWVITQEITGLKTFLSPQIAKQLTGVRDLPDILPNKVHFQLREKLSKAHDSNEKVRVIVEIASDVKVPVGAGALVPNDIERLVSERTLANRTVIEKLDELQAKLIEQFWITQTILLEIPLNQIDRLISIPSVKSVSPEITGEPPPAYGDIETGRQIMHSDYLFNQYFPSQTRIGLLEGSVNKSHTVLQGADIRFFDCTAGSNCPTSASSGPTSYAAHGTASASIIAGTAAQGTALRGVTPYPIDVYKVYTLGTYNGVTREGLNLTALNRSYQAMLNNGNRIAVAEVQACPNDSSTAGVNQAANNYRFQNTLLIAAAGNYGSGNSDYQQYCNGVPTNTYIAAPAQSKYTIAVGAAYYSNLSTENYQSVGINSDRQGYAVKPELQGPTCLNAAYSSGNTGFSPFCGTSGSTPFIGGLGALMYSVNSSMSGNMLSSWLIASGRKTSGFYSPEGAGVADINPNGVDTDTALGAVEYPAQDQTTEIALPSLTSSYRNVRAAIYWIDDSGVHDDMDLTLVAPNGQTTSSLLWDSTFEKTAVNTTTSAGVWKLRVNMYKRNSPTCAGSGICIPKYFAYTIIGDK